MPIYNKALLVGFCPGESTCEFSELLGKSEGLEGQLPGGGEDKSPRPRLGGPALEPLKQRQQEAGRLPRPGPGHRHHVPSFQDERDRLPLDGRRHLVPLPDNGLEHLVGEPHRLRIATLNVKNSAFRPPYLKMINFVNVL